MGENERILFQVSHSWDYMLHKVKYIKYKYVCTNNNTKAIGICKIIKHTYIHKSLNQYKSFAFAFILLWKAINIWTLGQLVLIEINCRQFIHWINDLFQYHIKKIQNAHFKYIFNKIFIIFTYMYECVVYYRQRL